jgi:fatty acid desaturase
MQLIKSYQLPKSKKELITVFLKNLFGFSINEQYAGARLWLVTSNFFSSEKVDGVIPLKQERFYALGSIIIFLSTIAYFGAWSFFVFHFVSLLFMAMFVHIRAISEHPYIRHNGNDKEMSFTVNAPVWETFFIAPCNANTHYAHHVDPNVPYFNLQKFSNSILDKNNIVFDSYLFGKRSVFNKVTT